MPTRFRWPSLAVLLAGSAALLLSGCDSDSDPMEPEVVVTFDLYDMKLTPSSGLGSESVTTSVWLRVDPYCSVASVKLVLVANGSEVTLNTTRMQDAKGTHQLNYEGKIANLQGLVGGAKSMVLRWRVFDSGNMERDAAELTLTVVGEELLAAR